LKRTSWVVSTTGEKKQPYRGERNSKSGRLQWKKSPAGDCAGGLKKNRLEAKMLVWGRRRKRK